MMKKNLKVIGTVLAAIFVATMTFVSCSKDISGWTTDYEAAKKYAAKEGKNIFLFFSGDDWDGQSSTFKTNIANTDEFISTIGKDYVLVNLDFSQEEYAKIDIDKDKATKEEKKNVEAVQKKYDELERIANLYNVQSYPSVYLTTPEGYVIATIPYKSEVTTTADYALAVTEKSEDVEKFTSLARAVSTAKKIDRVKAIDELYEASDQNYSGLLEDLMREVPTLDKNDETGLVGKYEMQVAYIDAIAMARKGDSDAAAQVFVDACGKGHFDNETTQEAYYTAAYVLAASGNMNYDKMLELLQKAYDADPQSAHAEEIQRTSEAVKSMQEQEAAKAAAEGPATEEDSTAATKTESATEEVAE